MMGMPWELDENTLGAGEKKNLFTIPQKLKKRKLIPPNKSSH